ncbi:MAG: sigma-70 family RNA polymerase sigma factor [Planctomycetales bacterium]|nr:sigma-70 family RNA polymerase sigma factor [Planctomycetales bacterium]
MRENQDGTAARYPSTRITLLRKVKDASDDHAWRQFVDQYTPLVFRYCRQRGLQDADACDVTQNVFMAVARAMDRFDYDSSRGRFRSWLGKVTVREIYRFLLRAKRTAPICGVGTGQRLDEVSGELESDWQAHYNRHIYGLALKRIQPTFDAKVWQAFELTWLQDRKPSEAAELLKREPQWVYQAKFRVLRHLRDVVQELADDCPLSGR